jgi:hypothetical protein
MEVGGVSGSSSGGFPTLTAHFKRGNVSLLSEVETLEELDGVVARQMIYYNYECRHSHIVCRSSWSCL